MAFCVYVGRLTTAQDNRFQLMKSNVLATKLDEKGLPVNKDTVLGAIRELNELVEHRFGQDARVVTLRASDPKKHNTWKNHEPVCKNNLSIEAAGKSVNAFVIDHKDTGTLATEQVDFLQGVIGSYMDLDLINPNLTKGQKRQVQQLKGLVSKATKTMQELQDKKGP